MYHKNYYQAYQKDATFFHNSTYFSFSALSSHFRDLHLFNFDDEKLDSSNDRQTPTAKRIAEGWMTYSLVEIKQRYNIKGVNN